MNDKTGLAIITCNREELFQSALKSLPKVDYNVVINDGKPLRERCDKLKIDDYIQHKKNVGIGKSKNEALKMMMDAGCDHLFISEDDVEIIDTEICYKYIQASKLTGIKHFNYAYHGPDNKDENGNSKSRMIIQYKEILIGLHYYLGGAFSYYHKDVIEKVGYLDERFKNYHEHVEHTLRIIKAGYHPPFWWFADLAESQKMIRDLDPDLTRSVIRKNKIVYGLRLRYYTHLFNKKIGCRIEELPKFNGDQVRIILAEIEKRHAG